MVLFQRGGLSDGSLLDMAAVQPVIVPFTGQRKLMTGDSGDFHFDEEALYIRVGRKSWLRKRYQEDAGLRRICRWVNVTDIAVSGSDGNFGGSSSTVRNAAGTRTGSIEQDMEWPRCTLTVQYSSGRQGVFRGRTGPSSVRRALDPIIAKMRTERKGSTPAQAMVGEELTRLADLRDRGVLTDAEFAEQKARLLGSGRDKTA